MGHIRTDPSCKEYDSKISVSMFTRGLSCYQCMEERRAAAEKAPGEAAGAPPRDWDGFLGSLGGGTDTGPAELAPGARQAQRHYRALYEGWQQQGFTPNQALHLVSTQLAAQVQAEARWNLEKGGA